jgi:hypothetical protein
MYSVNFCPILTKVEICRQILAKILDKKFHENPSGEVRAVPRGQTDEPT